MTTTSFIPETPKFGGREQVSADTSNRNIECATMNRTMMKDLVGSDDTYYYNMW